MDLNEAEEKKKKKKKGSGRQGSGTHPDREAKNKKKVNAA